MTPQYVLAWFLGRFINFVHKRSYLIASQKTLPLSVANMHMFLIPLQCTWHLRKRAKTSYHCSSNLKFNLIVGVVTDSNVDVGIFCLKIWKKRRGEERKGGERKKIRWKKDKFYIKSNNKLKIDNLFSDFFSRLPYLFFCFSFIFFQCVIEVFYYIVVEEMLIIPFRDGKIWSGSRFGLPGSEPEWQFILLDRPG